MGYEIFRKMDWSALVHEYDLDGKRLLPWDGYPMPFAAGLYVVRPISANPQSTK